MVDCKSDFRRWREGGRRKEIGRKEKKGRQEKGKGHVIGRLQAEGREGREEKGKRSRCWPTAEATWKGREVKEEREEREGRQEKGKGHAKANCSSDLEGKEVRGKGGRKGHEVKGGKEEKRK